MSLLCSFGQVPLQLFSFTSRWHQQLKEKKPADTWICHVQSGASAKEGVTQMTCYIWFLMEKIMLKV